MFSLNRAQVIGNMTKDPEMRYIPSGQAVTSFSVATNRRWKSATGEMQEEAQFHNIVAWGKLAEICHQILKRGNRVYVEGRLQTRRWDAPDGSKHERTEIVMENFVALTPKGEATYHAPADEEVTPPTEPKKVISKSEPVAIEKKEPVTKPSEPASDEEDINLDEIPF